MRSGPIAVIAALLSLALVLPGCGDDGTATAGEGKEPTSAPRTVPRAPSGSPAAARRCRAALGDLLDSIESLDNALAVGLEYEQYLGSVKRVRASHANVAVERLGIVCLGRVAAPAERALNLYIDAANRWGDCLASSCETESIEPQLQREWERASAQIGRAQNGLRGLS